MEHNETKKRFATVRTHDMSDRDEQDIIRNPQTAARRAWVDRAIECVRHHLASREEAAAAEESAERPPLQVVRSTRKG
jgi:oligoendopeptidase F